MTREKEVVMNKLKRAVRRTVYWLENQLTRYHLARLLKPTRF